MKLDRPIYLNNSSLEFLGCTRRYVYQVVMGANVPKDEPLKIGTLFHAYMKEITTGDACITLAGVLAPNRFAAEKAAVPDENKQLILADLACKARDLIKLSDDMSQREMWFEFDIEVDINGEKYPVTVCGTSDLREADHERKQAVVSDYKTTKKKIDADLMINYSLKSQMFFYSAALNILAANKFGPPFWEYARAGQLSRRYVLASYTDKRVFATPIEPISTATLDAFKKFIYEKAALAVYLHLYPEQSTKDGMSNNGCYFCPFKQVCIKHEPAAEARAIRDWHLGFSPYNPKHYDV